ncbi:hypothetical protein [Sphaerotilus sp.]|uniref:hypothetical protein n=1 Tax=Sphaerotilus sp. TaxID=2093942 RepID=UPI0034E2546F
MSAAYFLHWSDSELAGATQDTPATLRLRFAAAACRRVDDGLAGYLRPLELVFEGATWHGDGPVLGGVAHGSLLLDGVPLGQAAQVLPLPLDRRGAVVCRLQLISGTVLHIDAARVVAQIRREAEFRESYAC